jgi:hypothetical protein
MEKYVLLKGSFEHVGKIALFSSAESFRGGEIKVGESFSIRKSITTYGCWGEIGKVFEGQELEDLKKIIEQIGYERTCALFRF